jgi:hypothetical protein
MSEASVDSGETSELRKAAILVWHHQRAAGSEAWAAMLKTTAEQARRLDIFRTELHRILGERTDICFRINGGCVEADVEDLRFVALEFPAYELRENLPLVTLLGRCPQCGVEIVSEPFHSFAGLGKMLERFEPIYHHSCLP